MRRPDRNRAEVSAALAAAVTLLAGAAAAQLPAPPDAKRVLSDEYEGTSYSPYAGRELPGREMPSSLLWGDTHLHTAASFDAGAFGNRLGFDEAYRFARGEEVVSSTGSTDRVLWGARPAGRLSGICRNPRAESARPRWCREDRRSCPFR